MGPVGKCLFGRRAALVAAPAGPAPRAGCVPRARGGEGSDGRSARAGASRERRQGGPGRAVGARPD